MGELFTFFCIFTLWGAGVLVLWEVVFRILDRMQ